MRPLLPTPRRGVMRVGSLFSGVGGFDLGLEQAGHQVCWQCEADEWRRRVLASHWPGVRCWPDVCALGIDERRPGSDADEELRETAGQQRHEWWPAEPVDLICGGFPCQDLSVAGRRAGLLAGERSSLFFECARVADELLRPGGWLLLENVPGLLSSNGGRDYAVLLATLAGLGFHDIAWRVLDSRFFGVAQRRRRVFILARRARGERSRAVLLEPEGGGGDLAPRGEAGPRVAATLTRGTARGRGVNPPGRRQEDDVNIVVGTLQSQGKSGGWWVDAEGAAGGQLIGALTRGTGNYDDQDTTRIQVASQGVRRLTPVECERLQGFPDQWTALDGKAPDSRRYAAMGDAVTVNVARWIGQRLATHGGTA